MGVQRGGDIASSSQNGSSTRAGRFPGLFRISQVPRTVCGTQYVIQYLLNKQINRLKYSNGGGD